MTKKVPVAGIGDFFEEAGDDLMRLLILEADEAIKVNTPVDTGRMQVSWQIGEGSAQDGMMPPGNYGGQITPPKKTNYQKEKIGKVYSIHNNLPYAEANSGYSSGFPPSWGGQFRSRENQVEVGWLELISKNVAQRAEELWRGMT